MAATAALGRIPARTRRADAARFATVYERHHQALYRYCRSILRHEEDAQDALQSAMMRAFAALQTERRELDLRPWLFRIAHNEAVSILRRRTVTCALDEQVDDAATVEDRVFEREALRTLRADLAGLTERQRWALVLRELNGLAHDEIADVLETSPAAVKQAIFEARSALLSCREGRETACGEIRRMLSDGDGRVLRGRRVRAHLQTCGGCRAFRDDLAHRPRQLAALAPPLPAGAAAAVLRWIAGGGGSAATVATGSTAGGGGVVTGLAAKAAVAVVIAGGAVAVHNERPALHAPAAPVRDPAPAPLLRSTQTPAAGQARPSHGALAPARYVAHRRGGLAAPRHKASAGATTGGSGHHAGHGRLTAPGHTRVAMARGQARKESSALPPGQAGKQSSDTMPPARARKQSQDTTPPGRARRQSQDTTPPGQARRQSQDTTPPGQARRQSQDTTPPGQARKASSATTPPGQARKAAVIATPDASSSATAIAPGQARKAAVTETPDPSSPAGATPPGQARKAADEADPDATPPGQARKAAG